MKLLIKRRDIRKGVCEIALKVRKDLRDEAPLVIVCVMDGSFMFTADLSRYLNIAVPIIFVKATSYVGENSSGHVEIQGNMRDLESSNVLLVEDIIDTGLTVQTIYEYLQRFRPNNIYVCTLLDKPSRRKLAVKIDYKAFTVPKKFVIGYGMDYEGVYRNLPDIWTIEPDEIIESDDMQVLDPLKYLKLHFPQQYSSISR